MGLVDQGGQVVPAVLEAVVSEEVEAVGASEAVSRVDVEEVVVVVASQVEIGSRLEGAAGPEADSASKEATEAPTDTVAEGTTAVKPHRTHQQGLEDAGEAVGMAAATTEVPVEGIKAGPVGMVIGAAEVMNVVAGLEDMIATAVTGVAARVTGMATAMVSVLVLVLVLVLVSVLVLVPVPVPVPVLEVVEGLVGIEATTIGVVGPMEIEERTVIGVLMATGVRTAIVAVMIGAAREVMTGIRESAHTMAAMEGMVVAIGTGEGISSVIC